MDSRALSVSRATLVVPRGEDRGRALRFLVIELRRLELGEDSPNKNLRFDPERDPIFIVRDPDRRASEFPVRFQFKLLPDALELKVNLDRVVTSGANRNMLASKDSDRSQVGRGRRIDGDAIDTVIR